MISLVFKAVNADSDCSYRSENISERKINSKNVMKARHTQGLLLDKSISVT